jgi:hypothetical protein
MKMIIRCILATVIVGGLTWLGYEYWSWAEAQVKGTFLADYKFIPIVLAIFIALTVLEMVYSRVEKLIARKQA